MALVSGVRPDTLIFTFTDSTDSSEGVSGSRISISLLLQEAAAQRAEAIQRRVSVFFIVIVIQRLKQNFGEVLERIRYRRVHA